MVHDKLLLDILTKTTSLGKRELNFYLKEATERNLSLEQYLINQRLLDEQRLYQTVADYYGLPFVALQQSSLKQNILNILPKTLASSHQLIVFEQANDSLKIAVTQVDDDSLFRLLEKKSGYHVLPHITTPTKLNEALNWYHVDKKPHSTDDETSRIVSLLLEYALLQNASDIHLEPTETTMVARYRIDGTLRPVIKIPLSAHESIVSHIKKLARLDITENRLPQESRCTVIINEQSPTFYVSTLPTIDGEKIVLRTRYELTETISLYTKKVSHHGENIELL